MHEITNKSRRRGRPLGQVQVWREQGLRLHDLAFMRSVLQGQGVAGSAQRYLPEVMADARVARQYLLRLGQIAADTLIGMGEAATARTVLEWVKCSKSQATSPAHETPAPLPVVAQTPSLDEFAEEIDAEDFSEREIQEMYIERYGDQLTPSTESVLANTLLRTDAVLRALAIVQSRGVMLTKPTDPLSLWVSQGLAANLARHQIELLQDLVTFINAHGRHWYRHVHGVGQQRARRLVSWLVDHEPYLKQSIAPRSRWDIAPSDLVPAEHTANDFADQLAPTGGFTLRSTGANAAGAVDDGQALKAWLETLSFKSTNTQIAYARDAQRLLYWARERGKSLSTLTVIDAAEHARFLLHPPAHWVSSLPTRRQDADWRPMRGPLSEASAARALAAVGHLYGFLVETGYLVANPFARIRSASRATTGPRIDTTRSLRPVHLKLLVEVVRAMPGGPARRRARALLTLMTSTGVRIGEVGGTWGDVIMSNVEIEEDGQPRQAQCLRVVGKGGKERLLPLKPAVVMALQRHLDDRRDLEQQGLLKVSSLHETPLISVLGKPVAAGLGNLNGGLSVAGIHRVIKTLCCHAAKACSDPSLKADFEKTTAHWLRHTFAHAVLRSSGGDLPVTQQLLGHASLATTGIYLKADMGQRFRAVLAMPLMFDESSPTN